MAAALSLASRSLGATWPNPAVGCVLVRDGRVVGRGWTMPGGRPHAETEALRRAGEAASGACAYVTLEPCSHHGRTPPCADALIEAGVVRCVVAMTDPDPRVSGSGLARLRAAGVQVDHGLMEDRARRLNAGFLSRTLRARPWVTLKLAASLDGRIALADGESRWITGRESRAQAHRLRAMNDAVAVGLGTALADDPELTCRLPGLEGRSPVRVVFDSHGRLPSSSRLAASARDVPVWLVSGPQADAAALDALRERGVEVITVPAPPDAQDQGRPDPLQALTLLGARGVTRLLVEGGGTLAAALLRTQLIDEVVWFSAPRLIGADGLPALGALGLRRLADTPTALQDPAFREDGARKDECGVGLTAAGADSMLAFSLSDFLSDGPTGKA